MAYAYITRRATFSASHRLHSPGLSIEENRRIFGKCNSVNGHGHNYQLEVTVRGKIDPRTGMVVNLADLKATIEELIIDRVDHRHLNLDVPEFENLNPTAENLAVVFGKLLEDKLEPGLLHEIKLRETENNTAVYRGEDSSPSNLPDQSSRKKSIQG